MSEETPTQTPPQTQTQTEGAAEFNQDRLDRQDDATEIPGIPPEVVGNTTDIVSRDWTGVGGEAVDLDEEADEAIEAEEAEEADEQE